MRPLLLLVLAASLAACRPPGAEPMPGRELIYGFINEGIVERADLLLDDCWYVAPRFDVHCFDGMPRWDEDPFDERYWRFVFYSLRTTSHLLAAWQETGDDTYALKLVDILDSYDRNASSSPYMDDRHGTAFRAMVLVNSYRKLEAADLLPSGLASRLRSRIRQAGAYLADRTNFEGGYNHGVNQAAALLLVSQEFPATDGTDWEATALSRLDGVLSDVLYDDGVLIEQSPGYHWYVLAHLFQIDDWGRRFDVPLPADLGPRAQQMTDYAALVTQPDGWLPLIGSTDEKELANYKVAAFDRLAEQNDVLRYVRTLGLEGTEPPRTALFADSGQFIARSGIDPGEAEAERTHVVFDMGDAPAAHAQLDAMNVLLYARGRRLLVDSGMFTYEAGIEHDYFWSTAAHNSVVVDGVSQRRGGGTPMGSAAGEDWAFQSGRLDELNEGVVHRRGIALLGRDALLVIDALDSEAMHTYTQTWHLFPGAITASSANVLSASDDDGVALRIIQGGSSAPEPRSFEASLDPFQGWYSDLYEELSSAVAIEYPVTGSSARFATLILSGPAVDDGALVVDEQSGEYRVALGDDSWTVTLGDLAEDTETLDVSLTTTRGTP